MTLSYDDERRRLLGRLNDRQRPWLTNIVQGEIRGGATLPPAVIDRAIAALRARLGGWGGEDPDVRAMLGLLLRHRPEAEEFAAWCVEYVALPREQRERLKATRGEEHRRAYHDARPPTRKQLDYLRSLGYRGEVRSKQHASELIDGLLKARVA